MDTSEILVLIISGFLSYKFLRKWYWFLLGSWPPERNKLSRYILGLLPAVSFAVIWYVLRVLASFDVVNDFIYIIFYVIIGYAWIYSGMTLMALFFDLSWIDDVLNLGNKAALFSVAGGFLGVTAIYAGANIGDGPGWWCVIFAGGLGLLSWIVLGLLVNQFTGIFERINIERDIRCGIRVGFYLLAGGIILGRASSGDWTSFFMTVVEFMAGWPVIPLTVLMIAVERYYIHKAREEYDDGGYLSGSLLWGLIYIIIAVASLILLPLGVIL